MKDNYSEMNIDMEQILFSKEYDELTASEKEEIKDFISSKEDFYLMKNTLTSVKNSLGMEEEIEPNNASKEDLMKMFEQKHGKVVSIDRKRPFYLNPVFQIGVAALFILGIIYFYPKGENESVTAMSEEKEEMNKEPESSDKYKTEAPAEDVNEESTEATAEEEETIEGEKSSVPSLIKDAPLKVNPAKSDDVFASVAKEELKSEDSKPYANVTSGDTAVLYSDINRASASKKGKDKVDADKNSDDLENSAAFTSPATVTVTGGATTGSTSWDLADDAKGEKKESEKKKDGKLNHTNTADGLYGLAGKPAADLKTGVSLKDQPAIADFLFTAL